MEDRLLAGSPGTRGRVGVRMSSEVMDRTKIVEGVRKVVVEELGVKEEEVNETSSFTEDLGADSLDLVELVMAFEE